MISFARIIARSGAGLQFMILVVSCAHESPSKSIRPDLPARAVDARENWWVGPCYSVSIPGHHVAYCTTRTQYLVPFNVPGQVSSHSPSTFNAGQFPACRANGRSALIANANCHHLTTTFSKLQLCRARAVIGTILRSCARPTAANTPKVLELRPDDCLTPCCAIV
jgi:hypothetical protein